MILCMKRGSNRNKIQSLSPKKLCPMTTIESINPDTLERVTCEARNGVSLPIIEVVEFRGYYIILSGNYEMLAANIIGKSQVDVKVIPRDQKNIWFSEENLEKQLKTVGMNALYDFEALGGFKYPEYPVFYKGGK